MLDSRLRLARRVLGYAAGMAVWSASSSFVRAQNTVQIPLEYNFNGIIHTGEAGTPDASGGFRSISDRALDFSAGVPSDPVLDRYRIVAAAGALDIVHLGNRNTVDGGNWRFDSMADGDNIGVQPTWLAIVDQSGPQVTTLLTPVLLTASSQASFLYQISNGGGSFDITFDFASGGSLTSTLSGPDWYQGAYAGTGSVDLASPDANLSITEGTVDLAAQADEAILRITFSRRSNANGDYAILAANVVGDTLGSHYCSSGVNSTGGAAIIIAQGGASAGGAPDLTLSAFSVPDRAGVFFHGAGTTQSAFGNGTLCTVGGLVFTPVVLGAGNVATHTYVNATDLPPFVGSTRHFQYWFRDPVAGGAAYDTSNAISVPILP